MNIVKTLKKNISIDDKEVTYYYRMTEERIINGQVYGIEVERQDEVNGEVLKIERDYVKVIASEKNKANNILMLLSDNIVSPIHLTDIVGEYSDQCIEMMA